jgi:hypothetical protein
MAIAGYVNCIGMEHVVQGNVSIRASHDRYRFSFSDIKLMAQNHTDLYVLARNDAEDIAPEVHVSNATDVPIIAHISALNESS